MAENKNVSNQYTKRTPEAAFGGYLLYDMRLSLSFSVRLQMKRLTAFAITKNESGSIDSMRRTSIC